MSDTNRAGFEIRGRFYPWAQQFRTLDPLLVVEVTGMKYLDFLEQWQTAIASLEDEDNETGMDPIILNGLIAVAYWQAHPEKTRASVVKFFEHLDQDALEVVGGDEEEGKEHPDPLSEGGNVSAPSESSPPKPTMSNGTPESPSEQPTQVSTGHLPSITSVPV